MAAGNIFVTGASSGIGHACASRMAALGYRVLAGVRTEAARETFRGLAPGITPVLVDVCDHSTILEAIAALGDEPLAGLINNAGVAALGPLELVPVGTWRHQFEVNVVGLVSVTQACLPLLRRGRGRIVNIGSIAGRSALPGSGAYDASKFAVEGISDSLRIELRPFGISVSLVEPGAIATGIWQKTLAEFDRRNHESAADLRELYRHLNARIREETLRSAARALPAEIVAEAVVHALMSPNPKARYVVGKDAQFWRLLSFLPDRIRDWLIYRELRESK